LNTATKINKAHAVMQIYKKVIYRKIVKRNINKTPKVTKDKHY